MKQFIILLSFILTIGQVNARNNVDGVTAPKSPTKPLGARTGDCLKGRNQVDLNINNVRAKLLNSGDMWWDGANSAQYEVPKRSAQDIDNKLSAQNPLFAGSIWISGLENGKLIMAAVRYSNDGTNFYPGPLAMGDLNINKSKCNKFDKFWSVNGDEIKDHINGVKTSNSIKEWPGQGNPYLISKGKMTDEDLKEEMAPFYDDNSNGIYEYDQGDYPTIKYTTKASGVDPNYAAQMIFWVINDQGNTHVNPSSTPMGLQINCLAFGFVTSDDINNMTFYTYKIFNKSNINFDQTYMSVWADTDLGGPNDDFVGCDTTRGLGFVYNADDFDGAQGNIRGYDANVPILAIDFFEGPKKANGQQIGMSSFNYFEITPGKELSDPVQDLQYRNYQLGRTSRNNPLTESPDCITPGKPITKFCYTGNPSSPTEWSMCSANQTARDLRFVQTSGPFNMNSGTHETITVGVIFVQPPVGSYNGCKIDVSTHLFPVDEKAQRLFDQNFKQTKGPDAPDLVIAERSNALDFTIQNPIGSNNYGEKYSELDNDIPGNALDNKYKFEGYLVYQIKSQQDIGKVEDLFNVDKAKLVKAIDLNNDIDSMYNYTRVTVSGQTLTLSPISVIMPNTGINREFTITEDAWAFEGQKYLVNNKTYNYAVVTVAYNNYSTVQAKQNKQMKFSDAIKFYSASPHLQDFWGMKTFAKYGETIPVTRISGQGNGGYFLEFLDRIATEADILKDNLKDVIQYKAGNSPFLVRVNDPLKVKNLSYKLTMSDTSTSPNVKLNPKNVIWNLDIIKAGSTVATIQSEGNMDREYTQSIYADLSGGANPESLGISIGFKNPLTASINKRTGNNVHYPIPGESIEYSDSSKKWLNFIADANTDNKKPYIDWIRVGRKISTEFASSYNKNPTGTSYYFLDSTGVFGKILGGKIAPYCLTSNANSSAGHVETDFFGFGPAFKWDKVTNDSATMSKEGYGPENNLDSNYSFDLVITNENTKWTRCIVLETGDNSKSNEFGAMKGQLRKAPSLGVDLKPDGNGVGLSYFPGYAINLETGTRMNICFGENSKFLGDYAGNMIWDPGAVLQTALGANIVAGSQYVYLMNTPYTGDADVEATRNMLLANFNATIGTGLNTVLVDPVAKFYRTLQWTFMPYLDANYSLYNGAGEYKIPTEVRMKVRVEKPYDYYIDASQSVYEFNTEGKEAVKDVSLTNTAFDNMAIVPNPYNAYSIYENSAVQNMIKIVNVPKNSTVKVFTTDGVLVRTMRLSDLDLIGASYGNTIDKTVVDNSISWDLRSSSGVLISSGLYYINVDAPGIGSKVLKLFCTMRSADLTKF